MGVWCLKVMGCVVKTTDFVFKMMDIVFKTMI